MFATWKTYLPHSKIITRTLFAKRSLTPPYFFKWPRKRAVLITEINSYGQVDPVAIAFIHARHGMAYYPLNELAEIE